MENDDDNGGGSCIGTLIETTSIVELTKVRLTQFKIIINKKCALCPRLFTLGVLHLLNVRFNCE